MDSTILLKTKQSKILIALRDATQPWYVSSLAKATGTTYVHACNFVNACEQLGIVRSEKHGKLKVITLTDKGIKIADMLFGINMLVSQLPPQQTVPQPTVPVPTAPIPPKEKETK